MTRSSEGDTANNGQGSIWIADQTQTSNWKFMRQTTFLRGELRYEFHRHGRLFV